MCYKKERKKEKSEYTTAQISGFSAGETSVSLAQPMKCCAMVSRLILRKGFQMM